jgi:CDP-6-deoxy-D-xylo-4-hexulose-3-dehydrase
MKSVHVPLAAQGLEADDLEIVRKIFESGFHTMGKHVKRFEEEFAKKWGSKYAVMVNSGSSANLIALEAIIRPSDRSDQVFSVGSYIAVPAVLWPTTLWPIVQLGFKPLLIDCEPMSLRMDLNQLKQARADYGKKLIGAILIHPLGSSLDLGEITKLQAESDFFIIEDTCESLGSGNNGKYAGTVGDFGTFSFYFSHHITTVEGGMVTTNDENKYNDLCSMRAHGWIRNRTDRDQIAATYPEISEDFLFYTSGFNFRPMEFQGALGLSQLSKIDGFLKTRLQTARKITNSIDTNWIQIFDSNFFNESQDHILRNSAMAFPFLLNEALDRDKFRAYLNKQGVDTRPVIAGNFINQPAAKNKNISAYGTLENAQRVHKNAFMIGNHHNYTFEQIDQISSAIKFSLQQIL